MSGTSEIEAVLAAEREVIQAIQKSDFGRDVLAGLSKSPRSVPPKYFYDAAGLELFDRTCELPEYYPRRTELGIRRANAVQITAQMGAHANVVEFGAGSLTKFAFFSTPSQLIVQPTGSFQSIF